MSYNELQWGLTFSQVVWLLGLLNFSNSTKNIHEIRNKTISLVCGGGDSQLSGANVSPFP
eukprot:1159202-Pelagomonas_calceolata.AAC.17